MPKGASYIAATAVGMILGTASNSIAAEKPKLAPKQAPANAASAPRAVMASLARKEPLVTEKIVGRLKQCYSSDSFELSGDLVSYAYVCGKQGNHQVVTDSSESPLTEYVHSVGFAPKTNILHYFSVQKNVDGALTTTLISGGREIPTNFKAPGGTIRFDRSGKRYAISGRRISDSDKKAESDGFQLLVDGADVGTFDNLSMPVFSANSDQYAFISSAKDETMTLWLNGKKTRDFDKPKVPASFIFVTQTMNPSLAGMAKVFLANDATISLLVRDDQGWSIFLNDKRLASYQTVFFGGPGGTIHHLKFEGSDVAPAIMANSVVATADAKTMYWWARSEGANAGWRLYRNGQPVDSREWKSFAQGYPPKISEDGWTYAYVANSPERGKSNLNILHKDKQYGPYEFVWALALSPDGTSVAYAATDGLADPKMNRKAYVNGEPLGEFFTSLYGTTFASNGRNVAWNGRREKLLYAVLDGKAISSGDEVLGGPEPTVDGAIKWLIRRDHDIVEVVAKP